jgi:hypothetical protein
VIGDGIACMAEPVGADRPHSAVVASGRSAHARRLEGSPDLVARWNALVMAMAVSFFESLQRVTRRR